MAGDGEARRVYTPGDVAERLGVSDQRLRQLAVVFERVRGELPRDQRGRVWTVESIEELERARELVRDGRAAGVEQALRGELTPGRGEAQPASREPSAGDIATVAGEMRAMREAIEAQNRILEAMAGRLEALERQSRELRAALPAPAAPDPVTEVAPPEPDESPTATRETRDVSPGMLERAVRWWRGGRT